MPKNVRPIIHVPDVRATVDWYTQVGFTATATYNDEEGGLGFAVLSFGDGQVMFSADGQSSTQRRREVDLYLDVDNIDEIFQTLKDRVEVVEDPHDTFYGMREFIIRDVNRFWITFGHRLKLSS